MTRWTHQRDALRSETADLLTGLGPTTGDVAAKLGSIGVRGVPRSTTSCVLARYMHAVTSPDPRVRAITVNLDAVTILRRRWWSPRVIVPVPLPVQQFILRFDRGEYGDLVAEEASPRRSCDSGV
jgi:hypothetical protein